MSERSPTARRRLKVTRLVLCAAVGASVLIVLAITNYRLVVRVLRLDYSGQIQAQLHQRLVPIEKLLALSYGGNRDRSDILRSLREDGLIPGTIADLPDHHPALVDFDEVSRLNPYPPLLFEIAESYARQRNHTSLLYVGNDDRYHQITWYGGESFTTPSVFVPKVPESIYGGDYWISYRVLISRGRDTDYAGGYGKPQIEWIGWYSWRGGSYNGFEEIELNAALWALEIAALLTVFFCRWRWNRCCGRRGCRRFAVSGRHEV